MKKSIIFAVFFVGAAFLIGCSLTGLVAKCERGKGCEISIEKLTVNKCDTCSQVYENQ